MKRKSMFGITMRKLRVLNLNHNKLMVPSSRVGLNLNFDF